MSHDGTSICSSNKLEASAGNPSKEFASKNDLVRVATTSDLDQVFDLEERLRETRPQAIAEGFLLSGGDAREKYDQFLSYGSFYVLPASNGRISGFIFALPPQCDRMQAILQSKDKYQIDSSIWDLANLSWLAKVGVEPAMMGRGVATALYTHLLTKHAEWNFLTTTVFKPVRNEPSERLQARFGFEVVGTVDLGNRGALTDVQCLVHLRQAHPATSQKLGT